MGRLSALACLIAATCVVPPHRVALAAEGDRELALEILGEVVAMRGSAVAAQDALRALWDRSAAITQSLTSTDQELARHNRVALALLFQGQTEEAISHFRDAAEQGDAQAQFNLGVMYANGRGVAQDEAEAVRWYRKSAEQGYDHAQFKLGWMYEQGEGVAQDNAEAVRWYRKAAEQGNDHAQFNLGVMYSGGRGVAQDDAEAMRWYRKSAEQGNDDAQYNLGFMYANGRGVAQDDAEAVRWYRKSAEQGDGDSGSR